MKPIKIAYYTWYYRIDVTLLFSHSVVSSSLWPRGLQHARVPCPSLSPGVCLNSCPLSWWYHPTVIYCCPFLLPPSVFLSTRVISSESALHQWPKCWSFSFSISTPFSTVGSNILKGGLGLVVWKFHQVWDACMQLGFLSWGYYGFH